MASTIPIKIRGKTLHFSTSSKAALARYLLDEGYTVSEISKAVPMAYSQVHQIAQKEGKVKPHAGQTVFKGEDPWGKLPPRGRKSTKPAKLPKGVTNRVGKLRTPGLPSDIAVGPCANCAHDLVVRGGPTGFAIIHTNTTTEEYLAVTQFCVAVPEVLVK